MDDQSPPPAASQQTRNATSLTGPPLVKIDIHSNRSNSGRTELQSPKVPRAAKRKAAAHNGCVRVVSYILTIFLAIWVIRVTSLFSNTKHDPNIVDHRVSVEKRKPTLDPQKRLRLAIGDPNLKFLHDLEIITDKWSLSLENQSQEYLVHQELNAVQLASYSFWEAVVKAGPENQEGSLRDKMATAREKSDKVAATWHEFSRYRHFAAGRVNSDVQSLLRSLQQLHTQHIENALAHQSKIRPALGIAPWRKAGLLVEKQAGELEVLLLKTQDAILVLSSLEKWLDSFFPNLVSRELKGQGITWYTEWKKTLDHANQIANAALEDYSLMKRELEPLIQALKSPDAYKDFRNCEKSEIAEEAGAWEILAEQLEHEIELAGKIN